jgi:hypothetical protein
MNPGYSAIVRSYLQLAGRAGASGAGLALFFLAASPHAWAQWATGSGGTIYYNGGNVGIGTTNPTRLLEVSGANEPIIQVTHTGMAGAPFLLLGMNAGNNAALLQASNGKDFKFYNGQYALTILGSNGNVGIGTTNPQYMLAVKGTVGAQEVVVTNTGWADYVFQPGYRLRPLGEIGAYIKANRHLPDIPSQAEVKQKGVSVCEMQSKLLAKIEELTLHMIQEDERNSRLERENQELMDRVARLEKAAGRAAANR